MALRSAPQTRYMLQFSKICAQETTVNFSSQDVTCMQWNMNRYRRTTRNLFIYLFGTFIIIGRTYN